MNGASLSFKSVAVNQNIPFRSAPKFFETWSNGPNLPYIRGHEVKSQAITVKVGNKEVLKSLSGETLVIQFQANIG